MTERLVLTPIAIAARVRCSCGGEAFFIATGDDVIPEEPISQVVNNIECSACHQMYLARFERDTVTHRAEALEAEIGQLRPLGWLDGRELGWPARRSAPPAADHTDAERLAGIDAQINHARLHEGTSDVVFLRRLVETTTRRAEALEAENAHLRTQAGLPPIKTQWERATQETIDGQGLSMVAMGKELREKDDKIKALEAEVVRLRDDGETMDLARAAVASLEARRGEDINQWAADLGEDMVAAGESEYAPPAADHTERAREIVERAQTLSIMDTKAIADMFVAAERAGAEKMRERAYTAFKGCDAPIFDWVNHKYVYPRDVIRALPLPGEE